MHSINGSAPRRSASRARSQGRIRGQAESLKRLLAHRFGPLSAGAEQRIDTAPVAQPDAWLDGIFDVASLDDLI
ncbi:MULTISPECIES: DUF4351 domain-containing protein [unclassified Thiocapsa]|uniref:DUF4351 domain-containing protein n=1 Tax=unclassified Thiocapsa TaxID=2641286 RepID=UPI0035AFFA95